VEERYNQISCPHISFFSSFFSSMSKMAVFGPKPRIFRTQGHNSVLCGQSEFFLDPMGWFYDVSLQRAALETK
jgi:hypothetical protein